MASLHTLRPHISADGVYRAVGEVYEDGNTEHVAVRVGANIVEEVDGAAAVADKPKSKVKTKVETEAAIDAQPTGVADTNLIED